MLGYIPQDVLLLLKWQAATTIPISANDVDKYQGYLIIADTSGLQPAVSHKNPSTISYWTIT